MRETYNDNGQRKAISRDEQVITYRSIYCTAMKVHKNCRGTRICSKTFVRRIAMRLQVTGRQIGRICEARLWSLYLLLFYSRVERPWYYHQAEHSRYYAQLYLAA